MPLSPTIYIERSKKIGRFDDWDMSEDGLGLITIDYTFKGRYVSSRKLSKDTMERYIKHYHKHTHIRPSWDHIAYIVFMRMIDLEEIKMFGEIE